MKKKILICCLTFVLILLMGCNKQNTNGEVVNNLNDVEKNKEIIKSDTLTIGYGIDIEGLNTYNAIETKHNALSILYDNLFTYDNGEIKPNLAQSYKVSEDGTKYVLKLREDVKFSDGEVFNAKAVKDNFDILRKNQMFSWFGVLSNLKEVNVLSNYEVELVYNNPYKPALQELCMYQPLSMVSPKTITEKGIEGMAGTGPYVLESYTKDKEYIFVRNKNYWKDKPHYDKVILKIITCPDAMILALKTGEVDMVLGSDFITLDAFNQMKKDESFCCKVSDTVLKTRSISLNTNSTILEDKNVRLAIQHALNKEEFVNSLLYGLEDKAESLLNKDLPFCDVDVKGYDYNLEKAKKLLDEAGWKLSGDKIIREKDGVQLKLRLIFPTDFIMNTDIAQAIKGYMREIGVDVVLAGNEMMTWYAECIDGSFDMCLENTYGLPYDPYTLLGIMVDGSSFSICQGKISERNDIVNNITTILTSNSDEEIKTAFEYVLKTINDEAVYVPLSYQKDYVIFNKSKLNDYIFGGLTEMIQINNIK